MDKPYAPIADEEASVASFPSNPDENGTQSADNAAMEVPDVEADRLCRLLDRDPATITLKSLHEEALAYLEEARATMEPSPESARDVQKAGERGEQDGVDHFSQYQGEDDLLDFPPARRKSYRHDGWSAERQRTFIETLAAEGTVTAAAYGVGMSPKSAYRLRTSVEGKAFARAWDLAVDRSRTRLVDIAMERALDGVAEPVLDKYGSVIYMRQKMNDTLLMFLLRGHFPHLYGRGVERIHGAVDHKTADKASPWGTLEEAMGALSDADEEGGDSLPDFSDRDTRDDVGAN